MEITVPFSKTFYILQVVHLHTNTACSKLVHLFEDTLNLENDLTYLRRVFLMEAGDLLSEFHSHLFTKLAESPEECDSLSLRFGNIQLNFQIIISFMIHR